LLRRRLAGRIKAITEVFRRGHIVVPDEPTDSSSSEHQLPQAPAEPLPMDDLVFELLPLLREELDEFPAQIRFSAYLE